MQQWLRVGQSYEPCWWAEAAPCWCLAQSAAERYWRGRQLAEKATERARVQTENILSNFIHHQVIEKKTNKT